MVKKYLAREICKSLEIPTRSFQYWLDQGIIVADIRDHQPREYSLRQALRAALIYRMTQRGFILDRAQRIAKYAGEAWLSCMKLEDDLRKTVQASLEIYNGVWISIKTVIPHIDEKEGLTITWLGVASGDGKIDVNEADFLNGNFDEVYTINLSNIMQRYMEALGAGYDEAKNAPTDATIGVIRAEYPGNPDNKKLLVIVEKEN